MILAGDIGGTNVRLWLLSPLGRVVSRWTKKTRDFASLEEALADLLPKNTRVTAACFGVAGPVKGGRCIATNFPWLVDEKALTRLLGARVSVVNDLVALAWGATTARNVVPITKRPVRQGANVAVIAAGTGLGEAALIWHNECYVPLATEGGHADFAPRNALEAEVLAFFQERLLGRVSIERVLSGDGISGLYDFFASGKRAPASIVTAHDRNAAIVEAALAGSSRAAVHAVELFCSLYGAEAGNLALRTMATGGVWVCGSIAIALERLVCSRTFYSAFVGKGRFEPMLRNVPLALCKDPNVGLRGAVSCARALARG
jgi:glucokinase